MKFLFLESFYGGSHKEFARGLVEHSRHEIELVTLPERNWKWRMRGASLHFINTVGALSSYRGIIVSDMMNLADFKALAGEGCPKILVYFHENQITYPEVSGEKNDFHFGIINLTTALTADRILFNSKMHLDMFFQGVDSFIKRVPDSQPSWIKEKILLKSDFLYPGCRFSSDPEPYFPGEKGTPLIVWNHRWGYDKNANDFFFAIDKVLDSGLDIKLAIMGDNFTLIPEVFKEAKEKYGDRIVQFGYVENREAYLDWLKRGSIVISTAIQENFGMAMVEAMRFGCLPLLPNRLSYPEILPEKYHEMFLYKNKYDLVDKLSLLIENKGKCDEIGKDLSAFMTSYSWERLIEKYDCELEKLANLK